MLRFGRSKYHCKPQIIVSAALSMAFSLGEFGASWMLSGIGNWVTLSTLTDQLMSRKLLSRVEVLLWCCYMLDVNDIDFIHYIRKIQR